MKVVDAVGLALPRRSWLKWWAQTGNVFAVDFSQDQLRLAKLNATASGAMNISFVLADAYETGLPRLAFDVVYSRFLMS
jgi:ubiquinone/menaquinone biosynthesis C-methylase UbiE